MFIGNVVKATEEVIYNTSTVCNSLLIINFSLYRNMVYYVHICFCNLLKELVMCKVCPFQVTDIWENSGMKEIANKAISIYFYEVLIRNKSLNHQCFVQFLKCILRFFVCWSMSGVAQVQGSLRSPDGPLQVCSVPTGRARLKHFLINSIHNTFFADFLTPLFERSRAVFYYEYKT